MLQFLALAIFVGTLGKISAPEPKCDSSAKSAAPTIDTTNGKTDSKIEKIKLDLDYEDMVLFELDVVRKLKNGFIDPIIEANEEKKKHGGCKKCHRKSGGACKINSQKTVAANEGDKNTKRKKRTPLQMLFNEDKVDENDAKMPSENNGERACKNAGSNACNKKKTPMQMHGKKESKIVMPGPDVIFQKMDEIMESIGNGNEERKNKYTEILKPLRQLFKNINNKNDEIDAQKIVALQIRIVNMLGLKIMVGCVKEYNSANQEQLHNWWRVFRYTFPGSIIPVENPTVRDKASILRQPIKQYCQDTIRIYSKLYRLDKSLKMNKHLKDLFKDKMFAVADLVQLKLKPSEGGEPVDKAFIKVGELKEAIPITLSIYGLTVYRAFRHPSILLGDYEIHYGFFGVRLTRFGEFAHPNSMPYLKKVVFESVKTRFSVRQIQSLLDDLELNDFKEYNWVQKNCADFTKELLKRISTDSEEGDYPPKDVKFLEWPFKSRDGRKVELEAVPRSLIEAKWTEVDFLNNPTLVAMVKKAPSPIKFVMGGVAEAKAAMGGMSKKKATATVV